MHRPLLKYLFFLIRTKKLKVLFPESFLQYVLLNLLLFVAALGIASQSLALEARLPYVLLVTAANVVVSFRLVNGYFPHAFLVQLRYYRFKNKDCYYLALLILSINAILATAITLLLLYGITPAHIAISAAAVCLISLELCNILAVWWVINIKATRQSRTRLHHKTQSVFTLMRHSEPSLPAQISEQSLPSRHSENGQMKECGQMNRPRVSRVSRPRVSSENGQMNRPRVSAARVSAGQMNRPRVSGLSWFNGSKYYATLAKDLATMQRHAKFLEIPLSLALSYAIYFVGIFIPNFFFQTSYFAFLVVLFQIFYCCFHVEFSSVARHNALRYKISAKQLCACKLRTLYCCAAIIFLSHLIIIVVFCGNIALLCLLDLLCLLLCMLTFYCSSWLFIWCLAQLKNLSPLPELALFVVSAIVPLSIVLGLINRRRCLQAKQSIAKPEAKPEAQLEVQPKEQPEAKLETQPKAQPKSNAKAKSEINNQG
ncbi:MAG: hypothetical protein LBG97_07155 [Coriobacteriales bacterium]|jgi:hypothetical protein|nr:hypothetical protein [Coriobacteriales bacterium]